MNAVASVAPAPAFRPMEEADLPYVMSAWLKTFKRSSAVSKLAPEVYFGGQRRRIDRLIERAGVTVAADPDSPAVIWGWACAEPHVVHFVYVRPQMRGMGYGRQMLERFVDPARFTFSHWPPPNPGAHGIDWLRARLEAVADMVIYDPYGGG